MKKPIGIVTDSHSSIPPEEAGRLGVYVLPMPFYIDGNCYYENHGFTREDLFSALRSGKSVSTSQPSPEAVMEIWDDALQNYETILHIPLSSGLSGSCQTARMIAEDERYRGRVLVVDNGRTSTLLHRSILDALEMIDEGYSADQVRDTLEKYRDKMVIYIGVDTLEFLKRGGRVTPAAAAIGSILSIKPVLRFDVGNLDIYKKCRGMTKARHVMLEALRHDRDTVFKEWADRGELYLMVATSADEALTADWVAQLKENFPGTEILSDALSLGLSCHIGPDGLGCGWSCRPVRPEKQLG